MVSRSATTELRRDVGFFGAVLLGLGSIVGTGVFVSIGVAAGVAGPAVIIAVCIAAAVASFNGLSSAQLAANHPVSGGTYEYGYRWLNPMLGFMAGWMFLCAKSASAATAALGCAGYLLDLFGQDGDDYLKLTAVSIVAVITVLLCFRIRRSNQVNAIVVTTTLLALAIFVVSGALHLSGEGWHNFIPFWKNDEGESVTASLFQATALMFVAYTGYGRIATLGEEVHEPRRTIPLAIIATLLVSAVLYSSVSFVAIGVMGADSLAAATEGRVAPLQAAASQFSSAFVAPIVALGAVTAMLGVLLNLLLGLSRVTLAMGRRADLPPFLSHVSATTHVPVGGTIAVGLAVAALCIVGSVVSTWSFSALTVLIYYALTNASALALSDNERFYPRWVSWLGLVSCLSLVFFISIAYWIYAAGLLVAGFIVRYASQSQSARRSD